MNQQRVTLIDSFLDYATAQLGMSVWKSNKDNVLPWPRFLNNKRSLRNTIKSYLDESTDAAACVDSMTHGQLISSLLFAPKQMLQEIDYVINPDTHQISDTEQIGIQEELTVNLPSSLKKKYQVRVTLSSNAKKLAENLERAFEEFGEMEWIGHGTMMIPPYSWDTQWETSRKPNEIIEKVKSILTNGKKTSGHVVIDFFN